MKAITMKQPWAELIARGIKTVENRTQLFRYRGRLAIHAGKAADRAALENLAVQDALGMHEQRLDLGAVIATCTLVDCHAAVPGCCTSDWAERSPSGTPRITHLVLTDVLRIRPVFVRGALGLWEWRDAPDDGVIAAPT